MAIPIPSQPLEKVKSMPARKPSPNRRDDFLLASYVLYSLTSLFVYCASIGFFLGNLIERYATMSLATISLAAAVVFSIKARKAGKIKS